MQRRLRDASNLSDFRLAPTLRLHEVLRRCMPARGDQCADSQTGEPCPTDSDCLFQRHYGRRS